MPREHVAIEQHFDRMLTAQTSAEAPWVMPASHNASQSLSKGSAACLAEDVATVRERAARRRQARQEASKENVCPVQVGDKCQAGKLEGENADGDKQQQGAQDIPVADLDEWVKAAGSIEERAKRRRQVAELRHQEKTADKVPNKVFTGAKLQPVPRQGRGAQQVGSRSATRHRQPMAQQAA